ncbi:MAG: 50S ribosomal protein L24 [Betaproteobacteria bacterium]|nr:50S ribosomal protein L24 [Betaproteobacteria bacterium]
MRKLKKGDDVIIIAGKDKGKRGSVLRLSGSSHLVVQGVNAVKKHQKANPSTGAAGGIIAKEMPLHISNVAIYNFASKKADRVGFIINDEQKKVRVFRSNNELIET